MLCTPHTVQSYKNLTSPSLNMAISMLRWLVHEPGTETTSAQEKWQQQEARTVWQVSFISQPRAIQYFFLEVQCSLIKHLQGHRQPEPGPGGQS